MTAQSRKAIGVAMMVIGLGLFLFGIASLFGSGGDDPEPVAGDSTTSIPTSTTIEIEVTVPPPSTTATVSASTTTVEATTTTTTIDPGTLIEAFVVEFAAATAADDTEFLIQSIHPAVFETRDQAVCDAFVGSDIILLDNYRLTGPVAGPETRTYGQMTIEVYTAPVAFTFQGSDFEAQAGFALSENGVGWLTACE